MGVSPLNKGNSRLENDHVNIPEDFQPCIRMLEMSHALHILGYHTLLRHETAGPLHDPEYLAASRQFYDRHVCRVTPWPAEVARTFEQIDADPTVYHAMNGPTEFHVIGTMKDWTIVDRLSLIQAPTLLISGRHDEATPLVVKPYVDNVPGMRWTVFVASSHMPHVEERTSCMEIVGGFLDEVTDGCRAIYSGHRS